MEQSWAFANSHPKYAYIYGLNPESGTVMCLAYFHSSATCSSSHQYFAITVTLFLCSLPPMMYSWFTCLRLWSQAKKWKNYQKHILFPFKLETLLLSQSPACDRSGACGLCSRIGAQRPCWSTIARVLWVDGTVHVEKKFSVKLPEDNVIKSQLLYPSFQF